MQTKPKKEMINSLTGLRAYAALLVFISHFYIFHYFISLTGGPWREILVQAGSLGVSIFFVLSGFVLTVNYLKDSKLNVKEFYVSRIARIYPVFFITTLFAIPFEILSPTPKALQITLPSTLLMMHCFSDYTCGSLNRVGWSISHEWFFYLLFPLLAALLLNKGPKKLLLLFLVFLVYLIAMEILFPHSFYATRSFPLNRIGEFISGILIGYLYLRSDSFPKLTAIFSSMAYRPFIYGLLGLMFLIAASEPLFFYPKHEILHQINFITYLIPATVLVFSFAMLEKTKASLSFLTTPWAIFAGEISYSFYLLHHLILRAVLHLFEKVLHINLQQGTHIGLGLSIVVGTFIATTIGSAALYYTIEKPWRGYIKNWYKRLGFKKAAA